MDALVAVAVLAISLAAISAAGAASLRGAHRMAEAISGEVGRRSAQAESLNARSVSR